MKEGQKIQPLGSANTHCWGPWYETKVCNVESSDAYKLIIQKLASQPASQQLGQLKTYKITTLAPVVFICCVLLQCQRMLPRVSTTWSIKNLFIFYIIEVFVLPYKKPPQKKNIFCHSTAWAALIKHLFLIQIPWMLWA